MGELFVKICGVTILDDALSAVDYGADAVGFNFYPHSKRYISLDRAAEIAEKLPAGILRVGVFVNPKREEVNAAILRGGINGIQFSGNEPPEEVLGYHLPVIKAIHISGKESVEEMKSYRVDRYLLDTFHSDNYGGTGIPFDWSIAVQAKQFGKIIIAGGLTPENVGDAVRKVKPHGVDVSSGVELSPGIKDHKKMGEFILRAREANASE
jgi:phosphoribosylanthranilate isomerase